LSLWYSHLQWRLVPNRRSPGAFFTWSIRECENLEFWNDAFVFVSREDNLTKAQLRRLRNLLVEQVKRTDRFVHYSEPPAKVVLGEAQRPCVEEFFSRIRQFIPVLGSDFLTADAV
jgi:hypothetical protein